MAKSAIPPDDMFLRNRWKAVSVDDNVPPKRRVYLIGDEFRGLGLGLLAPKALWKLHASPVESFHLDGIWWDCLERNPASRGRFPGKFLIFRNLVGILKMEPH